MSEVLDDPSLKSYPIWWNSKYGKSVDKLDYDVARFVQYHSTIGNIFFDCGIPAVTRNGLFTLWPLKKKILARIAYGTCRIYRPGHARVFLCHYPSDHPEEFVMHVHPPTNAQNYSLNSDT